MSGYLAPFKVAGCLKVAGLTFTDPNAVVAQFTIGGRFNWFLFCDAIEKKTQKYSSLSRTPTSLPYNASVSSLPPLLRVATSSGSLRGTMPGMTISSSQQSLLLRPPHPQGFRIPPGFHGPPPPRGFSSNMKSSASVGLLMAKQGQRASRVRQIFTAADLRASEFQQHTQTKLEASTMRAQSSRLLHQAEQYSDPAEEMGGHYDAAAYVEPEVVHESGAKPKPDKAKLKKSGFVQSASNALNSRFSDMFKAFQYVDLDRSGTLDKKEIARALDMWNIPIDHDKLDDLIAACDGDGDGQVDYKEFVDVLARDTVASAAMGKRDMQAQEAMGVADLDPEFLGHKKMKNVRASINADLFAEDTPAPKANKAAAPTPGAPAKPAASSAQVWRPLHTSSTQPSAAPDYACHVTASR